MEYNIPKLLQKKKKSIIELWIKNQLSEAGLREDLISNQEVRQQSEELVDSFVSNLTTENINDVNSTDFDGVIEILSGISITRARQGFSPRETGAFIFGLKEALLQLLQQEIKDDKETLYHSTVQLNRLLDSFSIVTFETFIKGREEVILRQTDEITEISTPVIRVWDGILALPIIGTLDSARTQIVMENLPALWGLSVSSAAFVRKLLKLSYT
jgi:rsbT co-antagonist protein RsbR